ncbi:SIS domain-containing protein [Enterocloster hominis (ex Hitch et al. 2024)]|uniref:SIS domain-containing protein n=1 Tax=Enterocloster hominis (ex Hitch et al. 2024) TaxID=1917870 RepID=A0ABV1D3T8_9FIRM
MKGTSVMWDYIREEQEALGRMLDDEALFETAGSVPELEAVYIVAHGSSYNASVVMSDFLSRYMRVRVYGYTPANFMHNCSSIKCEDRKHCMVVAISQTGTSRGLLEAAGLAKDMGFAVMGVTQVKDSPLTHLADRCLYLGCGDEESNAKTKGYSSTLLALMIFGLQYGLSHGKLEQEMYQAVLQELKQCVSRLDTAMDQVADWCKKSGFGCRMENLYVLGAGMNYGTAMEGQLKLMETMCIPTMFNDIEEFSHGMHRSINETSSVILLNTDNLYTELISATFSYLMNITDRVLMLYAGNGSVCGDKVLKLDYYPLTQSVLVLTMAIQVLSVYIPEAGGYDPNREANDDYTQYVHTRVS